MLKLQGKSVPYHGGAICHGVKSGVILTDMNVALHLPTFITCGPIFVNVVLRTFVNAYRS